MNYTVEFAGEDDGGDGGDGGAAREQKEEGEKSPTVGSTKPRRWGDAATVGERDFVGGNVDAAEDLGLIRVDDFGSDAGGDVNGELQLTCENREIEKREEREKLRGEREERDSERG